MSATSKITVNVTQEHIDWGSKKTPCTCPIARAICDALGFPHYVYFPEGNDSPKLGVTPSYVSFYYLATDDKSCSARLPEAARQFVVDYDTGRQVYPFSFELEVPA
jgi:hypothetical protein